MCFNLTRVILSQIELGIDTTFWQTTVRTQDDGPRDVIPMRLA